LLFFGLYPVAIALMQGQVSFLLLLVYCACFSLLKENKEFVAGMVCALALLKFQTALPVAFLFLLWRRWRFVSGFASGAAGVAVLSLYVTGAGGFTSYWQSMISMAAQTAAHADAARLRYGMFPTDMANLHGLSYALSRGAHWGQSLTLFCSALLIVWAAFQRPSLPLAIGVAMLVSYHMPPHDLVLLILPFSFAINAIVDQSQGKASLHMKTLSWLVLFSLLPLTLFLQPLAMQFGFGYLLSFSVAGITYCVSRLMVSHSGEVDLVTIREATYLSADTPRFHTPSLQP
jgi:hypothetical protein